MPETDDGAALVREILEEFPAENRGEREEWQSHVGWHRKEDLRAKQDANGPQIYLSRKSAPQPVENNFEHAKQRAEGMSDDKFDVSLDEVSVIVSTPQHLARNASSVSVGPQRLLRGGGSGTLSSDHYYWHSSSSLHFPPFSLPLRGLLAGGITMLIFFVYAMMSSHHRRIAAASGGMSSCVSTVVLPMSTKSTLKHT